MMRELYFDLSMGAAGDMISASLLELQPDREEALRALNAIGIPHIEYSAEKSGKHGIVGTHLHVRFNGAEEGKEHEQERESHHHHHHSYSDICTLIDTLNLSDRVRGDVKSVYGLIARAEARVHGREIDNIHFHELGTMDALADISAACFLLDALNVERVTASPIRTGFGSVRCAHGLLPVPAPATAILLEGMPVYAGDIEGEMCTPTGAALIKYFASGFGALPPMTVKSSGYGIGTKDFPCANCLRATLGESEETIIELSCNVDDMSPEAVGFAIDALLSAGAPDAYYQPVGMKKNRPGLILSCLCRTEQRDEMLRLIFRHTSTIGVRETLCRRYVLKRREELRETPYGAVRVKISDGWGVERIKGEYDDLSRIARDEDMTLDEAAALLK